MLSIVAVLNRIALALTLVIASLPVQAGMVCVANGRVVARCTPAMMSAMVAPKPAVQFDSERPSCCRHSVAPAPSSGVSVGPQARHCAYVYETGLVQTAVVSKAALSSVSHDVAVLPEPVASVAATTVFTTSAVLPCRASRPPPRRTHAPDLGRAPPISLA